MNIKKIKIGLSKKKEKNKLLHLERVMIIA
jgi:hypothetical protein